MAKLGVPKLHEEPEIKLKEDFFIDDEDLALNDTLTEGELKQCLGQ